MAICARQVEDQRSRSRQAPLVERLVGAANSVALVLREIAVIAFTCAVRRDNGRGRRAFVLDVPAFDDETVPAAGAAISVLLPLAALVPAAQVIVILPLIYFAIAT